MPCSYCPSPHTLTCHDCQQSFCHTFRGTTSSHIVFHLAKTAHKRVGNDSVWHCCMCGDENAFNLGVCNQSIENITKADKSIEIILKKTRERDNNVAKPSLKPTIINNHLIVCLNCMPNIPKLIDGKSFSTLIREPNDSDVIDSSSTETTSDSECEYITEDENKKEKGKKESHVINFSSYKEYTQKMIQMLKKENEYEKLNKQKMARKNVHVRIQESSNKILAVFEYPRDEDQIRVSVGDEVIFELSEKRMINNNKNDENNSTELGSRESNKNLHENYSVKGFILNDTLDNTYTAELSFSQNGPIPQSNIYNLTFPYRNVGYLRMKKAIFDFKKKCSKQVYQEIIENSFKSCDIIENNSIFQTLKQKFTQDNKEIFNNDINTSFNQKQSNSYHLIVQNMLNVKNNIQVKQPKKLPILNNSQIIAIENTFNNSITLIQGPPGTGKTITSVSVVYNIYYNEGFDDKEFIEKNIKNDNLVKDDNFANNTIQINNYNLPYFKSLLNDQKINQKQFFSKFKEIIKKLINKNKILVVAPSNIAVDNLSRNMIAAFSDDQNARNKKNFNNPSNSTLIPHFFHSDVTYSNILRIVSRNREGLVSDLDKITLHQKVEIMLKELMHYHFKLHGSNENKKNEKRVKDLVVEWCYMCECYSYMIQNKNNNLNFIISRLSTLKQRIEKYATLKLLKFALRFYILTNSKIIISTCVTAGQPLFYYFKFPFVIIDEAVQATEPLSIIPLCYGAKRVVAVGDHRQLGPTILSCKTIENVTKGDVCDSNTNQFTHEHTLNQSIKNISLNDSKNLLPDINTTPLKTSLFERLIKNNHIPFLLSIQYRMDPLLCEWVSNTFYNGMVKSYYKIYNNFCNLNLPKTFFYNSPYRESFHNSSFLNEREGIIVKELVNYLNKCDIKNNKIAVITPYEAQRNYLNNILNNNIDNIEIANVDAFQGREKDYIIISLVRSNKECEIGFLKSKRRMNVALTRGKKGIWIIGNVRTYYYGRMYKEGSKFTLWHSLIQWYMKRGLLLEGEIENLRKIEGKEICFGDFIKESKE